MRSRRRTVELACRVGAFAALGWLLGVSVFPAPSRGSTRATPAQVEQRLAEWTRAPRGVTLHGDFPTTPSAWAIDWLAALKHSGHVVTWSGSPPALAMATDAIVDPRGGARVDVAAPNGARVVLRDEAGLLDSVRVASLGGSIATPVVVGRVVATAGDETASAAAPESLRLRSIVVAGVAGWEGKFIVAALEERGWPVIARFSVSPNVDVSQGARLVLDTARVAAVIAVDTSLQSLGPALERFVRAGGGLILAGPSSRMAAISGLAPGSLGERTRPAALPADTLGLGSTGYYPVANLKSDAIALERRSSGVAIAARRVGAGRVLQVGYDDSWRWRMAGAAGSENAHREWWGRLVSAVAYAPSYPGVAADVASQAPLAMLVDRLGPARSAPPVGATRPPIDRRVWLGLIMILLLVEWASRRLRGLK